ncbi:MAG: complex I subunit 1 family protein [Candidatus Thermoplasmatota archaeon]
MELVEILQTALMIILGTIGLAAFGVIFGLLFKGIDRKLAAHMQGRVGPPIKQPFLDVVKLFTKENIVPENAIPWVFNLAPLVALSGAISILLYLPIVPQPNGGLAPLVGFGGDLILILYLLMIPALGLIIGGFASGSPYATVGAQREMATMIAYEFPLAIIAVTVAWRLSLEVNLSNVFSFATISSAAPIWTVVGPLGFIGFLILLFALILVTPAELSKIPFDTPEAETEIAEGVMVEYSGRNLGMFYLADGVKTVVMASLIVALFFPFNLSPLFGLNGIIAASVDVLFFLLKVFLVILFSVTLIRVAVARLKIDQIVYTYWVPITLIALVGLIFVMWDTATLSSTGLGWPRVIELLGLI